MAMDAETFKRREDALNAELEQFIGLTMTLELRKRVALIMAQHVLRWKAEDDSKHATHH